MTYRREMFDIGVAVRQPARTDQRPDLPGRTTSLAAPPARPPHDVPANLVAAVAADAPVTGGTPEVILVKSGFRQVAVRVREILYVEAARNYVRIHLETGAILKSRVQIDRLARHLGSERFCRIHRGRLVSMDCIRSVRPLAGGRLQLTLAQGATILVARDRRRAVLAEIGAASERRR